ncbi:rhodanese-like domain-containing protein [Desulfatibacillum aliphaticivorans]|uniref:rhodanese-like domain-containing protein n=1 Tax=Desulfatibacillum aliphaticivorans TaxID=218208 RepID=UPI00041E08A0|nr:rhodanese-like domain-containing protein [Desulfatibacillum aliphaticivorans]
MQRLVWLLIFLSLFVSFPAFGMERFKIVTTEEMRTMLQQREEGKIDFLLVNTLDKLLFDNESIPGSINVPWASVDKAVHRLGTDKDHPIILYCKGYR